ncbi:MAG: hypothetical protein NTV07_00665 [Candidatus Omnitrophica bacterium]|nr:hypothetical protein [Candidatus Omnitrophota bacterium]
MIRLICVILFLICVSCAPSVFAVQNNIAATVDTGYISSTDTTEERDVSGNLDYYRVYAKFGQELSKTTKYSIAYSRYHKDYDTTDNLDFTSDSYRFGFDHTFENFDAGALKLDLDAGVSEKDYTVISSSSYERSNASLGLGLNDRDDKWALHWKAGFINYDYDKGGNDQLKAFTKLSGWVKFLDERLKIGPSYKFQNVEQKNTEDRIENTWNILSSYKLKLPYFSELGGFYEQGKNDTKDSEDDDRDDNLQFKYTWWWVNTDHPITNYLNSAFRYGQMRRSYETSGGNSYRNWYIQNKNDFKFFEDDRRKFGMSVELLHKEVDFPVAQSFRYRRNSVAAKFPYRVKNNWELTPSAAFKKYDHHADHSRNETQYEGKLEFSKEFKKDLELKLGYRYTFKDYEQKPDVRLWSVKAGFEYKF